MEVRVLGPVELTMAGRPRQLGGTKQRAVLAMLALHVNKLVSVDHLVDGLWGQAPPESAVNAVQVYISRLRKALRGEQPDSRAAPLRRRSPGYLLELEAEQVDLYRFERLAGEGARAVGTDPERAAGSLRAALGLWRGPPLAEFGDEPFAPPEASRLEEKRLAALEARIEADLAVGRHAELVGELRGLVLQHPLRERLHQQLLLSLYRSGRQGEALAAFRQTRQILAEELGVDPCRALQELEAAILAQDRRLDLIAPPEGPLSAAGPTPRAAAALSEPPPATPRAAPDRHDQSPGLVAALTPGAGIHGLRVLLPAARTATPPVKLPAVVTELIGRERELAETAELLARSRVLTLIGSGGSGKTTLAVELARRVSGRHPEGTWLVELAALTDPDLVVQEVAGTLGLDLPPRRTPESALVSQVGERDLLLVLDNCEHLVEACARLVTAILRGCQRVTVLATSREPLRVAGELTWRIPSLALPDPTALPSVAELADIAAVRLFVERATSAVRGFRLDLTNAADVAAICSRLDGMPLALELAAACVATLTPGQIADRLGDSLALLRRGSRSALTRQQTLAATLAWSHDLLSDREQRLFRRLSVFAGSFTLEAVEAICGPEAEPGRNGQFSDVLDPLARLVDTSLVTVDTSTGVARYRLLETVRQYAAGCLRAADEADLLAARHLDWYVSFAEQHDPDNAASPATTAFSLLDIEHDNLRTALATAVRMAPPTGLRLAAALGRYWLARGHFGEGRRWLDDALAGVPESSDLRSRALHALAVFDMRRGRIERLGELGAEIVDIHRTLDDRAGLAQALQHEALLAFMRGRWGDCDHRLDECLRVAEDCRDWRVLPSATHLRGLVALSRGHFDTARAALEETRRLLAAAAPTERPGFTVVMLGIVIEHPGTEHAHVLFEETVVQGRSVDPARAVGYLLGNLAYLARLAGDLDEARSHLLDAVEVFQTRGDPDGEALALNHLGCVLREQKNFAAGRDALSAGLKIRQQLGDRRGTGLSVGNLALLSAAAGDVAAARAQLQQALRWFEETEDAPGVAGSMLNLAAVNLRTGDTAGARRLIEAVLPGLPKIPGYHRATGWALATLAQVQRRDGDRAAAATALQRAADVFARLGAADGLAHCSRLQRSL